MLSETSEFQLVFFCLFHDLFHDLGINILGHPLLEQTDKCFPLVKNVSHCKMLKSKNPVEAVKGYLVVSFLASSM